MKNKKKGFFDFLSRELDAERERSKNFILKKALKLIGVVVIFELAILGLMILIDQYQRYVGSSDPIFGQMIQTSQDYDLTNIISGH